MQNELRTLPVPRIEIRYWSGNVRPIRATVVIDADRERTTGGCSSESGARRAAAVLAKSLGLDNLPVFRV